MKFKIMEDMEVTDNDEDEFDAKSNDIFLKILTIPGETLTYEGMKAAIIDMANSSTNFKYSTDGINRAGYKQPMYLTNLDHFWGITLEGAVNGGALTILLLVNPDNPDICYHVIFSYHDEYWRDIFTIMNSFKFWSPDE